MGKKQVIPGLEQGLMGMKVSSQLRMYPQFYLSGACMRVGGSHVAWLMVNEGVRAGGTVE